MKFSSFIKLATVSALVMAPVTRAQADGGDFVAGAIVGGIVGAVANQNAKNNRNRARVVSRSRIPSTAEGREIQSSLNYFGFNAGRVDGQLGRQSHNAISQYQAYMGNPVTGDLSPFEQNLLITSWNRAQIGGPMVNQVMATSQDGTRGLLKAVRSEMAGVPMNNQQVATYGVQQVAPASPGVTQVVTPVAPPPATVVTPAPSAPTVMAFADSGAATPATGGALPNFMGKAEMVSLASHCNKVSLLTNTNGGFVTEASMADPEFALSEQFCLARTYAIAEGEELATKVQGFTPQQIAAQCDSFGPAMKDYVASLSLKPMDAVVQDVAGFVQSTGMAPAQLAGTAKICLSVGYRTDNMDVAVGSALLLVTLGEKVYSELLGHHVSQGFGASKRADLSLAWYEAGLEARGSGAAAVFAPGQPDRDGLIRKAAYAINGTTEGANAEGKPMQAGLPTFTVKP